LTVAQHDLPPWLCATQQYVITKVNRRILDHQLPGTALPTVMRLLDCSAQWNTKVAGEIGIAISFLLFGNLRVTGFEGFTAPEAVAIISRFPSKPEEFTPNDTFENVVSAWAGLIETVVARGWAGWFPSLGSFDSHRSAGAAQRSADAASPSLGWLFTERRDLLAGYAAHQDMSVDEFRDLISLVLPAGYRVDRRISNTSAFKIVYNGTDLQGTKVALKRYRDWTRKGNAVTKQLDMPWIEVLGNDSLADWHNTLRHTHILPCSRATNELDELFLVEPLLTELVAPGQNLDPDKLCGIFLAICDAVNYLHSKPRILHCDIKHDNIGIHNGLTVLLDLGLARRLDTTGSPRGNAGSLKTRAPELFTTFAEPTPSSDVFALGATLMALANGGDHPFITRKELETLPPANDSARKDVEKALRERVEHYRRRPSDLDRKIRNSIPKRHAWAVDPTCAACRFDPDRRPSTTRLIDFLESLDGLRGPSHPYDMARSRSGAKRRR
jgi:hypothetical protein